MQYNSLAFQIRNRDGRQFNIRLVRQNSACGADDSLIHRDEEPMLEFFDASYPDEESANALGYFTGIRCTVGTLFQSAFELGGQADELFNESLPIWNISSEEVAAIQDWVMLQLEAGEKHFVRQAGHGRRKEEEEGPELACTWTPPPPEEPKPGIIAELPRETGKSEEASALVPKLLALLQSLDELEHEEATWRMNGVQPRLHLLEAKQNLLRALAALEFSE